MPCQNMFLQLKFYSIIEAIFERNLCSHKHQHFIDLVTSKLLPLAVRHIAWWLTQEIMAEFYSTVMQSVAQKTSVLFMFMNRTKQDLSTANDSRILL
jgi:hypothetical protein